MLNHEFSPVEYNLVPSGENSTPYDCVVFKVMSGNPLETIPVAGSKSQRETVSPCLKCPTAILFPIGETFICPTIPLSGNPAFDCTGAITIPAEVRRNALN